VVVPNYHRRRSMMIADFRRPKCDDMFA